MDYFSAQTAIEPIESKALINKNKVKIVRPLR